MPVQAPHPPTLTNIASVARGFIKYGAILIVVLIVGRVALNITSNIYRFLNPPKPPGPTYGFGALPAIEFPQSEHTVDTYTLQTRTGTLQPIATLMRVYFMPVNRATLFSLDKSKQIATSLGFAFAPEELSSTLYRWRRTTPLPSVLEIEIVNQSFEMQMDWSSDPNFLTQKNLPQSSAAILEARNILRSAGLLETDIATGEATVKFLKASGASFAPAVSLSEADFLQVDVFRAKPEGTFNVLRSDPSLGVARVVLSGNAARESRVAYMEYQHYPVEYERFETYGLISPTDAWNQLQNGNGFIAQLDTGVTNVVVREVSLAYYDSDEPQHFLQPIYVFTGDNGFVGYVPAAIPAPPATR